MAKKRKPQLPKRRNPVKKHMDKLHRPQTHRDRTKYRRQGDKSLEDRLQDWLDDLEDEYDS